MKKGDRVFFVNRSGEGSGGRVPDHLSLYALVESVKKDKIVLWVINGRYTLEIIAKDPPLPERRDYNTAMAWFTKKFLGKNKD